MTRQPAAYPSPLYGWTVVGILVVTAVVSYTDRQVLSLLVDPIRHDLKISDTEISLLLGTAFALVYGVVGIAMGFLADRFNRRNLIGAGILIWCLATIGCGLASDFGWIVVARASVGIGEAVLTPAAVSLISDCFGPERRGTAVAVYIMGIPLGGGVAIIIGGLALRVIAAGMLDFGPFIGMAPWRLVLLLIGGPGLLLLVPIFLIREPARQDDPPVVDAAGQLQAEITAPWRKLAPCFIAVALISMVDNAAGNWVPSLLIRNYGIPADQVGLWFGLVSGICGGGGVLLGGLIGDRAVAKAGRSARLRLCGAAVLVALPFTAYGLFGSPLFILAGVGIYFLLADGATVAGISAILDFMPNRLRGLATSVSFFLNVALGAGFGPTLVALILEHVLHDNMRLDLALASVGCVAFILSATAFRWAVRRVAAV